jgi:Trypsin-like peptidase domain
MKLIEAIVWWELSARRLSDRQLGPAVKRITVKRGAIVFAMSLVLAWSASGADLSPPPIAPDPPAPPSGGAWSGIVLRITFTFPERRLRRAGTGFVVQDRSGQWYLLTCAHLTSDKDWETRHCVMMQTMDGRLAIESYGPSLYHGPAVNPKAIRHGRVDTTTDLVIRSVAGQSMRPLPLAAQDPRVGDWVWAVGRESASPRGNEKLFPCQIRQVADGGYVMKKHAEFDPHGFSGGPIVNAAGKVVGNVIAGGGEFIQGATVTTLRQHLKHAGIEVD